MCISVSGQIEHGSSIVYGSSNKGIIVGYRVFDGNFEVC